MNIIAKVLYGIMDFFINKILRVVGRFLQNIFIGILDAIFFGKRKSKKNESKEEDAESAPETETASKNDEEGTE